jgi:hypothetical protein
MKYYSEQLLCGIVIFLSLSFNFFTVGDEKKNAEKVFSQFVERAKLFGDIFEKGEPEDLAKMFIPYQHAPIIVIRVQKDYPPLPANVWQDHDFYISYVNASLKFSWADYATIRYFRNIKASDNLEHIVAISEDLGKTVGGVEGQVSFNKEGVATECNIVYNSFHPEGEKIISSSVKWDEKSKIIAQKDWNLITEKSIAAPPVPRSVQEKLAKKDISNHGKTFFSFKPVQLPNVNGKKVEAVFKRIEYLANMKRPRDLAQLFNWELTKKESSGAIQCFDGKVRNINFISSETISVIGYNLSIDEGGNILAYAEGNVKYGESREPENLYQNKDKSRQYYWNAGNSFYVLNKGIEVIFHPNGYPASYRTVVNNRLFGRQIEWDDKGEVLSDVDLDIPKEWKDVPKKNEPKSK